MTVAEETLHRTANSFVAAAALTEKGISMKRESFVAIRFLALPLFLLVLLAGGLLSEAQEKKPLNIDKDGVAVDGYDPVAYFTEGKAIKGDPQNQSSYAGAIYYFQSSADKEAFDKEPSKYVPQYGGYCAMAMSMGKLEDVNPNYFLVYDGKLLLQRNEKAHMMFVKDPAVNHKKADDNWEKMSARPKDK
jgi:YHS domain-containing protein